VVEAVYTGDYPEYLPSTLKDDKGKEYTPSARKVGKEIGDLILNYREYMRSMLSLQERTRAAFSEVDQAKKAPDRQHFIMAPPAEPIFDFEQISKRLDNYWWHFDENYAGFSAYQYKGLVDKCWNDGNKGEFRSCSKRIKIVNPDTDREIEVPDVPLYQAIAALIDQYTDKARLISPVDAEGRPTVWWPGITQRGLYEAERMAASEMGQKCGGHGMRMPRWAEAERMGLWLAGQSAGQAGMWIEGGPETNRDGKPYNYEHDLRLGKAACSNGTYVTVNATHTGIEAHCGDAAMKLYPVCVYPQGPLVRPEP
jgi:hypothetical protein